MVRYIKRKNGQMAGSIGGGRDNVPAIPLAGAPRTPREPEPSDPAADYEYLLSLLHEQEAPSSRFRDLRAIAVADLHQEGYTAEELAADPGVVERRVAQQRLVATIPSAVALDPPGSHADRYDLDAEGRPRRVWYASYGSNLFAHRFDAYVRGGQPEGSSYGYPGCRDTSPPQVSVPVVLNGTIHYAGEDSAWTGGSAFLDTETAGKSLGRAYLITAEQFDDVVAQENGDVVGSTRVDLARLLCERRILGPGLYGTLAHVGDHDGAPVLTFTGSFTTRQAREGNLVISPDGHLVPADSDEARKPPAPWPAWPVFSNAPSPAYRKMIAAGLAEAHNLTVEQADTYFAGSTGHSSR